MYKINKQQLINLFIGIILGFIIWVLSPIITGELEPWDTEKNAKYYPIALFIFGFIACMPYPNNYLIATLGIFIGQLCFLLFFRFGPLFFVGAVMIALYSFVAFFGAIVCNKILPKKWGIRGRQ